ncbi:MAG TPA: molybdenum cofactor guanylyltransferase [Candidatus Polarisedimenticolaceae bacterium]|nr:molybdenum cofactor guanylyltransferase [Candidatus Polarisedimenticolaceae bacterium]
MPQTVGVVLAGGRGDRLGRTKGDLAIDGNSLAERAASLLWPLCGSVLISIADGMANPAPDYPVVVDRPPPGRGPLVGIDAAFAATGDADLLVLACDYPRVSQSLMRRLASHAAATDDLVMMTDFAGRDHPLVGLWRRAVAGVVRRAVETGRYKVRALLLELRVRRIGPAEFPGVDLDRVLLNVNSPEELARLSPPESRPEWPR